MEGIQHMKPPWDDGSGPDYSSPYQDLASFYSDHSTLAISSGYLLSAIHIHNMRLITELHLRLENNSFNIVNRQSCLKNIIPRR